MNASEAAAEAGKADPLIRPLSTPAPRPGQRTLQLVPPLAGVADASEAPRPVLELQPLPASEPAGPADPALASANRLIAAELAEVEEELQALQELLEELPAIFERKFQQRLGRVLEERRQLEADNRALWSRLRALAPGVEPEIGLERPHGLLPPASGSAVAG